MTIDGGYFRVELHPPFIGIAGGPYGYDWLRCRGEMIVSGEILARILEAGNSVRLIGKEPGGAPWLDRMWKQSPQ